MAHTVSKSWLVNCCYQVERKTSKQTKRTNEQTSERRTINHSNQIDIQSQKFRLRWLILLHLSLSQKEPPFLCDACIRKHDVNPAVFFVNLLKCSSLTLPGSTIAVVEAEFGVWELFLQYADCLRTCLSIDVKDRQVNLSSEFVGQEPGDA